MTSRHAPQNNPVKPVIRLIRSNRVQETILVNIRTVEKRKRTKKTKIAGPGRSGIAASSLHKVLSTVFPEPGLMQTVDSVWSRWPVHA